MTYKRTLSNQDFLKRQVFFNAAKSLDKQHLQPSNQQYYYNHHGTQNKMTKSVLPPYILNFKSSRHSQKPSYNQVSSNNNYQTKQPSRFMIKNLKSQTSSKNFNDDVTYSSVMSPINLQSQQVIPNDYNPDFNQLFSKSSNILSGLKKKLQAVRGINKELILQNCKLRGKLTKQQNKT